MDIAPAEKTFKTKIVWDKNEAGDKDKNSVFSKQALLKRKERFGDVSPPRSKFQKAAKQPITVTNKSSLSDADMSTLKKRSERFGENVSSLMKKIDEKDKLTKRQARFTSKPTVLSSSDQQNMDASKDTTTTTTIKLFKTINQIEKEELNVN